MLEATPSMVFSTLRHFLPHRKNRPLPVALPAILPVLWYYLLRPPGRMLFLLRHSKGIHILSVFLSLPRAPFLGRFPGGEALADQFGETVASVKINSARTRWGSCTSKGNINLSLFLVMAPEDAVDYCIIHELSHLKHMDNWAAFWRLVGSRCPDYEKRKEDLRFLNLRLMREKW